MNCPYCDKDMERGFVRQSHAFYPLVWRTGEKQDGVFIDPGKEIKLTSFHDIKCPMHYCGHCRKFIVDEAELNT